MINFFCFTDKSSTAVQYKSGQGNPIEGTSFTLECVVNGGRPGPNSGEYKWYRDTTLIIGENDELTLTLDQTQHDGMYTCSSTNTAGPTDEQNRKALDFKVYCKFQLKQRFFLQCD